jgi:hypothetical protein
MFPVARAMRLVGCFIHLRLYLSFCLLAVGPKGPFLSGIHLRKMKAAPDWPILKFREIFVYQRPGRKPAAPERAAP